MNGVQSVICYYDENTSIDRVFLMGYIFCVWIGLGLGVVCVDRI